MRQSILRISRIVAACLFLLAAPALALAQADQAKTGAPPVSQALVSEGEFAMSLHNVLIGATAEDEVSAESALGDLGIAPRNGWIADYPVTPDIIVEVQTAVEAAATGGKLSMSAADAVKKLQEVTAAYGLTVRPYTSGITYEPSAESCLNYPNPAMVNDSYSREGAPVVTYYCPPPAYYNLYAWVPEPFLWSDLWFPGFFILHDFHRVVHHRKVVVVTNHFHDLHTNRAFRIDPVKRHNGRTFAGIGVTRHREFIPTGIPRSERTIFNAHRPAGAAGSPMQRGGERFTPSSQGGGQMIRGGGDRGGMGTSGGGRGFSGGGGMGTSGGGGRR
ncbi:MAG TPA: hypothetical protein VIU41_06445 [Geobacteraceae bacterium]